MKVRSFVIAVVCALLPAIASPQALTSLSSLRVGYNTRKTTAQPQGELKAQIDALDKEIAEANRLGRTAELRRLFAKGNVLLAGRPWTDAADYASSLVIRSDRVVVDSSKPYFVRLEQIYSPSIQLERPLKAHVELRARPAAAGPRRRAPPPAASRQGSRLVRRRRSRPPRCPVSVRSRPARRRRRHVPARHRRERRHASARHGHAARVRAQGSGRSGRAPRGRREEGAGRAARRHSLPDRSHETGEPRTPRR